MAKEIIVEFSPNGILGRVTGPNLITYPGVFLGLPFDVHTVRGTPVYGPDVQPDTTVTDVTGASHDTIKATLPERTPAQDSQSARAFLRLGPEPPTMGHPQPCPACGFPNGDVCEVIGHTYPLKKVAK